MTALSLHHQFVAHSHRIHLAVATESSNRRPHCCITRHASSVREVEGFHGKPHGGNPSQNARLSSREGFSMLSDRALVCEARVWREMSLARSAFEARRGAVMVVDCAADDGSWLMEGVAPAASNGCATPSAEGWSGTTPTAAAPIPSRNVSLLASSPPVAAAAAAAAPAASIAAQNGRAAEKQLSTAAGAEAAGAEAAGAAAAEVAETAERSAGSSGGLRWRRVLLKVSGEALAGDGTSNIDAKIASSIAREVAHISRLGVQVAIVVGGGNFFRGASWSGVSGLDRTSADHIGMLATVMNAIFLQACLESEGVPTRVQTAFRMCDVAEPYIRRRATRHLEKGRVVIFAGGAGIPFFTTDTAAALRAAEIDAEVLLKATNVDGVYDTDPHMNPSARLLPRLSHRDVTLHNLRVMDATAITLAHDNQLPVVVFNLTVPGNIVRALSAHTVGTLITP